jgi:hypothetical protein
MGENMIQIEISCAMCGEQLFDDDGNIFFEATRSDDKPHYNLDEDLDRIAKEHGWVYQADVCGDMYCSEKCAE